MSIILKGNNIGSSDKGIGPSEVTNIKASQNVSSIILSWTNPSNVVINGTTLSKFDHVIVVRNTSQVPSSEKDGIVIYNGNSTTCTDSSVTKNTKYHYRIFVYDTKKLVNNAISMTIESTFYGIDQILANNTWDQIAAASEAGIASEIWNIGDGIDITLSGTYNENITLQIWDFDHFDKSDGSGKAGICFGMANLMKSNILMNSTNTSSGGWNATYMKKTAMQSILESMDSNLRSVIKEVNTYANGGNSTTSSSTGKLSTDKVFLPGHKEVFGSDGYGTSQNKTESGQTSKFPIFTDYDSRIKRLSNGSGGVDWWWTRSPRYGTPAGYCCVTNSGSITSYAASYDGPVCFCFNV